MIYRYAHAFACTLYAHTRTLSVEYAIRSYVYARVLVDVVYRVYVANGAVHRCVEILGGFAARSDIGANRVGRSPNVEIY